MLYLKIICFHQYQKKMEKRSKEDILLQSLLKDAGMEKPSVDFSAKVLASLNERRSVRVYKPLISQNVWIGLGVLYGIGILLFIIFNSDLSLGQTLDLPFLKLDHLKINFPTVTLSQTMSYAIALVSLFLLQIPFLKHYIDKGIEADS